MPISAEALSMLREEEECLKKVLDSLREQLRSTRRRLGVDSDTVQMYEEQIRASRLEEDRQQLASDQIVAQRLGEMKRDEVAVIEKLLDRPYIARIVLEELFPNGKIQKIEYKIGLQPNIDCRIIDWKKAPLSRLYYEFKEGDEYSEVIQGRERNGKILTRNKIEIVKGELKKVICKYGDFVLENGEWKEASVGRKAKDYGSLPDVLSLITPEQFKAITDDANSAVMIQGVAGSGKTTVAMYRLAWLLQREESELTPEDCVIIVRSGVLKSYIKRSLPALGLADESGRGVEVLTYIEWAERTLATVYPEVAEHNRIVHSLPQGIHPLGVERVKRSMAMLTALENYALNQKQRVIEDLERVVDFEKFSGSTRRDFQKLKEQTHQTPPPRIPNPSLVEVLKALISECEASPSLGNTALSDSRTLLTHLQSVRSRCELYWQDLVDILSKPESLLRQDETGLLDRELIAAAKDTMQQSGQEQVFDAAEDALLLRLYQIKNSNIFLNNKIKGLYKHIVVDEVQDFSPIELATVIGSVSNLTQLTVVGDSAQELHTESTFPGWEKLRTFWKIGDSLSQFMTLTVSYRSSLQIMQFADYILGERRTTDGRQGAAPLWFKCLNENSAVTETLGWLTRINEKYPDSITAVVCRTPREASFVHSLLEPTFGSAVRLGSDDGFSFEEGIIVCAIEQIKGLEFPHVLIWNPSSESYPKGAQSKNLLYVAATRAEEYLALVTWGRHSNLLPDPYSKLVRLKEEELEEFDEPNPLLGPSQ